MSGISSVFSTFQAEPGVGASALVGGLEGGEKGGEVAPAPLAEVARAALEERPAGVVRRRSFNL